MLQQIDVMNQVDADWPASRPDTPFDIEIVIVLVQPEHGIDGNDATDATALDHVSRQLGNR